MNAIIPILMGSKSDYKFAKKIGQTLEELSIPYEYRVASAHKSTQYLLNLIKEYDSTGKQIIYIAVAGRSNALSGVLDANTTNPVITCPPYSEKFSGADIYSSLRMPSGLSATTILEPEGAALAAAKTLALANPSLVNKLQAYKEKYHKRILDDDQSLKGKTVNELD